MTSHPLDIAALGLLQALTYAEEQPGPRARHAVDCAIGALHALVARRVRLLVHRHGLGSIAEDAEQACLIALVDAVRRWDPARSGFATWLGWQLRAVLAGLRRQWHGDTRSTCGRNRAATLSFDDGPDALSPSSWLTDPGAEQDVERGAADWLAIRCADRLASDCPDAARAAWLARLLDEDERRAPPMPALRKRH
jgi:hypothetical protein